MPNLTAAPPVTTSPLSISSIPDPIEVELTDVVIERDELIICLAGDHGHYALKPQAQVLLDFHRFRDFVLDVEGVWISHWSQEDRNRRRRRRKWSDALAVVFDRRAER